MGILFGPKFSPNKSYNFFFFKIIYIFISYNIGSHLIKDIYFMILIIMGYDIVLYDISCKKIS